MMLISVLIPVFNAEKYLKECITSILSQTYQDFEIILCDDGSTDLSCKICEEFEKNDDRIRFFRKENTGAYDTRIALAGYARGQYALYIDADDFLSEHALEIVAHAAEKTQCDIIQFGHYVTDDYGQVVCVKKGLYPDQKVFTQEELKIIYRDFLTGSKLHYLWEKLISVPLLQSVEYVSLKNSKMKGNDAMQMIPILFAAKSLLYLDEALYYYRQSRIGMGRNFRLEYFSDARLKCEKKLALLTQEFPGDSSSQSEFFKYYRNALTSNIISSVHSKLYSKAVLKDCFDEERSSSIYAMAVRNGTAVSDHVLHKIVFFMFRHKLDNSLMLLLTLENAIINGIIRKNFASNKNARGK